MDRQPIVLLQAHLNSKHPCRPNRLVVPHQDLAQDHQAVVRVRAVQDQQHQIKDSKVHTDLEAQWDPTAHSDNHPPDLMDQVVVVAGHPADHQEVDTPLQVAAECQQVAEDCLRIIR